MTLPGGPADTSGNRYEHWWTLSECVRLLHGATETLRIETLGAGQAELVATAGMQRELHHARRGHPDGAWSLAALAADDDRLLQAAGDRLAANGDRFIFVSASAARELSDLCAAAGNADSPAAFERGLRAARELRAGLAKLLQAWICDVPAAFERLRRIDVRTVGERDLERNVRWGVQALFLADADRVMARILAILTCSVPGTTTRRGLVERLARRGCRPRRLLAPNHAGEAVGAATDRYLDGVRRRLIRGAAIARGAAATLSARLEGRASESVLTGRAGAGKTACVAAVVDAMRARGMPVLALRLDHVLSATTTTDLGRRLDLEESPVLVLAEAVRAARRPGALIVDQVDAVSLSGRRSDSCAIIEHLLHETRGIRARAAIHAVVVCRTFDWKNDPRLRRLMPARDAQIEVSELARDELENVLQGAGCDPAAFEERQLEILRLPQHLYLFLEAAADASCAPAFTTTTALFDRYWTGKRRAAAERAAPLPDQWLAVVQTLCDELASTRELTAPRERLDAVSPAYLERLAAEGVVTLDGRRCGFGHQTLFDYCAARVAFNRRESLVSSLAGSEQHLFRRVRIRQALAYLRDADPGLYVRELGALLAGKDIRPHVKDLAFALLADVPDPTEQEWTIWEHWIAPALAAIEAGTVNPDPLSALGWRRFFESPSWFRFADRRGTIEGWLAADNDRLATAAVSYLRRHNRHAPDLVAALLEPYADLGGAWKARLRSFMEWADHHASRRLFELFLRLVDNGTLDEARGRDAVNGTFWSMLRGLGEHRPEWVPEVVSHRLRRRLTVIHAAGEDLGSHELPGYDDAATTLFDRAAERAPAAFVEHVLPPVLDISDATLTGDKPPKHDAVWPIVTKTEYPEVDDACLAGLAAAVAALAADDGADLQDVIAGLRRRDTHVANRLLLALYRGGAARHADDAVSLLCDQPWRFQCGFSDSPQWYATRAIRAVTPHCTVENRERIERATLDYVAPDERGLRGYRQAGRARFALLSAIPAALRSKRATLAVQGLERKFGKPEDEPREITVDAVESPVDEIAADVMTDAQWLSAIARHRSDADPPASPDDPKRGAWDLARQLEARAGEQADRFARLALRLPADAHPVYLDRTLAALRNAAVPSDLKLQVCHKAFVEWRGPCGRTIAGVLGSIADPLPNDAVRMLHWLATEHDDPAPAAWRDEDVGMDTARGSAADAVRSLIVKDAAYVERFGVTLERLIRDPSAAVRACVAGTLQAVVDRDPALGMTLFHGLDLSEDRLLAVPQVYGFIRDSLRDRFAEMSPTIERMLRSSEPQVCEAGARLACLAALEHAGGAHAAGAEADHRSAADLAAAAQRGGPALRRGVAHVAAANLAIPAYRSWSEATLAALFDDGDAGVRRRAAACFRQVTDAPLETYGDLIAAFCNSTAFGDDPASILQMLDTSRERLPGTTCTVCERFLDRFADEALDARSSRHEDAATVATLVFRTYQQHQQDAWTGRALDLIDRLCLERIGDARDALEQFEG